MHPLENQLENQLILFQKSLLFLEKNETEIEMKTNLALPSIAYRHPRHSQSFLQFRTPPAFLALILWVNVLVCKRRVTVIIRWFSEYFSPAEWCWVLRLLQTAVQNLNQLWSFYLLSRETPSMEGMHFPPKQPERYWSVIYFIIYFAEFSLLFCCSVLCGKNITICAVCSLELLLLSRL